MSGALGLSFTFVIVLAAELARGGALIPLVELYGSKPGGAVATSEQADLPSLRVDLYDPVEEYLAEVEAADARRARESDPAAAAAPVEPRSVHADRAPLDAEPDLRAV